MLDGEIDEGKRIFHSFLKENLPHLTTRSDGKVDLFGGEWEKFLRVFSNVWRMSLEAECQNPSCINPLKQRYPISFSVDSKPIALGDQTAELQRKEIRKSASNMGYRERKLK